MKILAKLTKRNGSQRSMNLEGDGAPGVRKTKDDSPGGHRPDRSVMDRVLRIVHPVSTMSTAFNPPNRLMDSPRPSHVHDDPPDISPVAPSNIGPADHLSDPSDGTSEIQLVPGVTNNEPAASISEQDMPKTTQPMPSHSRFADFKPIACNTAKFALVLLEKVSESFPFPGVKGAISSVNAIIDRVEKTDQNVKSMKDLEEYLDSISGILSNFQNTKSTLGHVMTIDMKTQISALAGKIAETKEYTELGRLNDELDNLKSQNTGNTGVADQIKKVSDKLTQMKKKLEDTKKHSKARKVVDALDDAQLIQDQYQSLHASINEILVGAVLKTEAKLADQHAFELLDKLPRAKGARYDYIDRPKCSPGTRLDVLRGINKWVSEDKEHQIYWLNGGAGTGKTTVALTLAHSIDQTKSEASEANNSSKNILSASFFCSRDNSDRSNIRNIFPTLAYLYAQRHIGFRNELVAVIKDSPDIGHALVEDQCSRLLLNPLKAAGILGPAMIVLDALDECTDARAPETILTSLASKINSVNFLKVFVSSRPTSSTNDAFMDEELRKRRAVFVLHDVESHIVGADIKSYIISRLEAKARLRKIDTKPWPPEHLVDMLVGKADGLFIYASTVCEFVEKRGDLDYQLKLIAERPVQKYTGIDALYQQIIETAIHDMDEETVGNCKLMITTIIHLQNPLSSNDLGSLLGFPAGHVQSSLGDFQSVLVVPENKDEVIHTLHASFHDFLTDKKRCLGRMYIPPSSQHKEITLFALKCMNSLKRDICGIGMKFKADFHNLQDLCREHISGSLNYACRHWVDHLCYIQSVDTDAELLEALDKFASTKLLHWIETLSLLGILDTISGVLERARTWYDSQNLPPMSIFKEVFDNAFFTLPEYLSAIDECPSQIYCSVLSFMDPDSRLYKIHNPNNSPIASVSSEIIPNISCVSYSADGNSVISGITDGTVIIWDPKRAHKRKSWNAHSKAVIAVAYSPDGKMLSSASSEGTLKIWDTVTGDLHISIDLPGERINAKRLESRAFLAFSPDSALLAFTSSSSRHIWDTKQWKEKRFTRQGGSAVHGGNWVSFSPDKNCFAVADIHGIYLFDPDGLHYIVRDRSIHRHLMFSTDGTLIRSTRGTYDITMAEPVDTRTNRSRFSNDLYVHGTWIIDAKGNRCCWVPESHRQDDFHAAYGNKIVFIGAGRLRFLELSL